jgi:hypothetical protein
MNPQAISLDAGSTDSGAAYLATGKSKNDRNSVKHDLELIMGAQIKAGIPILIGSSGQAGGDINVDWTLDIVQEVARELGYSPKIALLYSEQDPAVLKRKLADGKVQALAPMGELDDATIDRCLHIVALMGPEPYFKALDAGADIIIGGRSSDPAVIAAFALWKGAPAGPSWHAGKIAECGGQATTACTGQRGVFLEIGPDWFEVEPVDPDSQALPEGISGHLLYENKNPWLLTEPGGQVDVTESDYVSVSDRRVRVTGTKWLPTPYTMKLEGAAGDLFQTIMIVGIHDPLVLNNADEFHEMMSKHLNERAAKSSGLSPDEFNISLRFYGYNGVSGRKPPAGSVPLEIGVMCVVTAKTQEQASQIAKACNPYFFHMPLRLGMEMPSWGLPFTPGDIDRGPVYQFLLNHVVQVDDPLELVRMKLLFSQKEAVNA